MKIWFFWTGEFSVSILKGLVEKWADICLLVSQPDKPVWRKMEIIETPVKKFWIDQGLEVFQPTKLRWNEAFFSLLKAKDLDFIVVVAYWKIIPKEILDIPRYGCINLHGSTLPLYRWASPIQEAIKNWDMETWLTVMYMSEGMDEWDILKIAKVKIDILDKTLNVFNKFSSIWPDLLMSTLNEIMQWNITPLHQDSTKATYCWKIEKENGKVDFHIMKAKEIYDLWRAYSIWPWIYTTFEWKKFELDECFLDESVSNQNFVVGSVFFTKEKTWIVANDGKILFFKKVKLEWKKSMDILSFINGNKHFKDYIF